MLRKVIQGSMSINHVFWAHHKWILRHQDVLSLLAFTSGYNWSQYSLLLSNLGLYSKHKIPFLPWLGPLHLSEPSLACLHFTTKSSYILFPVVFCFCDFVHIVPSSWDVIPYLPFLPSECLFIQQDPTQESILWGVLDQSIITYNSHLYKQRVISFVRPLYLYDNYIYICHTTLKIAI